jgi:hypothetical protein
MRPITGIIIHCAATPNGRWHDVRDIDEWHKARGFHRQDEFRKKFNPEFVAIGYHFVIYNNGAVATGRHLDEIGAHAKGFNSRSIGICLIGTDKFSIAQWENLRGNIEGLLARYPAAKRIIGHRDLPDVHKECPGFSVADWLKNDMQPLSGHVMEPSK